MLNNYACILWSYRKFIWIIFTKFRNEYFYLSSIRVSCTRISFSYDDWNFYVNAIYILLVNTQKLAFTKSVSLLSINSLFTINLSNLQKVPKDVLTSIDNLISY